MARGRKPVPTKLKIVRGNPGRRPLNENEPKPEVIAAPPAPDYMNELAQNEWERMASKLSEMGLLTALDLPALEFYCQCYARSREAEDELQKTGITIETKHGNVIQNPLVGIANKSKELAAKFLVEFGMTPSSRSKVKVSEKPKASEWDDM